MAKLKFDDLSEDIKAEIVGKLLRPTDLKNICLVNKQLHTLAVKHLYRTCSLDLGSPADKRLTAFLNPRNIGLKHIRQMRLYLTNQSGERCNQEQQARLISRMILEFLPEDVLEEFRCGYADIWCPWSAFPADDLLLLYKKQRRMKWIEVMDLDRDILPKLKKNEKTTEGVLKEVRKLALYPENRETLRLCEFFVARTREVLEELLVHAAFHEVDILSQRDTSRHGDPIEPRELNDSATEPGLLTRTIFSSLSPFETCEPFKNLRSLRLHRINLRYCTDTWCKFVNFTNIESLRIYQCAGADSLFGQLCKANNLPKQLEVLEFQHKDNTENEALLALDGFLCLVSGLRDLAIDLERVKALPAAAGIARHGKTLNTLNIHCSPDPSLITATPDDSEELVYDIDDFGKICKACTKLEQLSCAWPATSLIRAPSDEWEAFETHLRSLKGLVTLHISTFPNNKPSSQYLPRAVYETLLQSLAQRGFRVAADATTTTTLTEETEAAPNNDSSSETTKQVDVPQQSKLRLIAYGISDKVYEREESKNQLLYLRSSCLDAEGKTGIYATPISWCLRSYVEPRSDVLDFVLNRETKPPCRENFNAAGLGWGDAEFLNV